MKRIKKTIAVLLSVIVAAASLTVFASASGTPYLQFGDDGKYKIMLFADIQDDRNVEETTLAFMNEAIEKYQPDLVIYLGDNAVDSGWDGQYATIKAITEPCVSHNTPFAVVFGNHDQESGVDKEDMLNMYREFGCLTYDANPEMYGCGTCNLPIFSHDGKRIAFNLWLTDSGSRNTDEGASGYDYVHQDQIDWYKKTAASLKAYNSGTTVPSMNFQHIVVPEIYDILGTELQSGLGDATREANGKIYSYFVKQSGYTGLCLEPPCPPSVADGQLDAWVETGDVIAAFCGHDHTNCFTADIKGVDNINVPTCGCSSYYNDMTRGIGLVTLDENDNRNYSYELIHIYDMAMAKDSAIPSSDGGKSVFTYSFDKFGYTFLNLFHTIFSRLSVLKK